jgi:pyrroline-5-carboxylate reductase
MGGALLRGWLASGIEPGRLAVKEPHPSPEMAALLSDKGIAQSPRAAPDVIVLAVKPQMMDAVLTQVAPEAGPQTAILSIAAGRTIDSLSRHFAAGTAIIRSMPNLPAEVGLGITAACANAETTAAQREQCEALLRAVGEVVWLDDETLMDAVTAVSGSGPAYVFYLTECLAEAGRAAGLPEDVAMKLARATVMGAGELLRRSPLPAAKLRENVTSPAGTTAAGLSVLMSAPGLKEMMIETVAAAARRSRELSK